jgi:hypothetical protein
MKTLPLILFVALAMSCEKKPADTVTSDTTTTPADTTMPPAEPERVVDEMSLVQNGDIIELMINNKKALSFNLPDSAKVEVTTGKYGYVLAKWEPYGLVTYKSFAFEFKTGYCSFLGDEGTSQQTIDTLAYGPGFVHSQFDNLVAGTDGIEEFYDVISEGYCMRFVWTLMMGYSATPEDRMVEIRKMEEFLKTVKFE